MIADISCYSMFMLYSIDVHASMQFTKTEMEGVINPVEYSVGFSRLSYS